MNVLITGGAGYIGSELVLQLLNVPGIGKIKVYDNLSQRNYSLFLDKRVDIRRVDFINADIFDTTRLRESLSGIDLVYHLAGFVPQSYEADIEKQFELVNRFGAEAVMNALQNTSVSALVYLSSARVYDYTDKPANIYSAIKPQCTYSESMLKAENYIRAHSAGLKTYIIRCSDVFGHSLGMNHFSVINRLMFEVNFLSRIRIDENLKSRRSYIHLERVTRILAQFSMEYPSVEPGVYNLTQCEISLEEIAVIASECFPGTEIVCRHIDNHCGNAIIGNSEIFSLRREKNVCPIMDELILYKSKYTSVHQQTEVLA